MNSTFQLSQVLVSCTNNLEKDACICLCFPFCAGEFSSVASGFIKWEIVLLCGSWEIFSFKFISMALHNDLHMSLVLIKYCIPYLILQLE